MRLFLLICKVEEVQAQKPLFKALVIDLGIVRYSEFVHWGWTIKEGFHDHKITSLCAPGNNIKTEVNETHAPTAETGPPAGPVRTTNDTKLLLNLL